MEILSRYISKKNKILITKSNFEKKLNIAYENKIQVIFIDVIMFMFFYVVLFMNELIKTKFVTISPNLV